LVITATAAVTTSCSGAGSPQAAYLNTADLKGPAPQAPVR